MSASGALASNVCEQLNKEDPSSWITFLEEQYLSDGLEHKQLTFIFETAIEERKRASDQDIRALWDEVILSIAGNPKWCQALSYRYFLDYVENSFRLAEYIVKTPTFLIHLDYYHIDLLLEKLPTLYVPQVLRTFDNLLQDDEENFEKVICALKWIFIKNPTVRKCILTKPKFGFSSDQLLLEFENDKLFAIDVLKNESLCENWIKQGFLSACSHPLLKNQDYQALALHYKFKKNPVLSSQYLKLVPNPQVDESTRPLTQANLAGSSEKVEDGDDFILEDIPTPISVEFTQLYQLAQIATQQDSTTAMEKEPSGVKVKVKF